MKDMLSAGLPIKVDFFYVYPWKLKDIVNVENRYYEFLFIFFLKKDELGFVDEFAEASEEFDVFDLIRVRCIWGEDFRDRVLQALKMFTKEDFIFEKGAFHLNGQALTADHWSQIQDILALENDLDKNNPRGEEEFDFANEAARKFRERVQKTRDRVNKYKKKNEVTLGFLVNRLSAKSPNLSILTIWDCTFYQFKQQLDATLFIEQYDGNILAWSSGNFDMKNHKLTHWTENN